jgi:hypothetical protein
LQALRSYLQQPLTDKEKIPIPQDVFDELCSSSELTTEALDAKQLSTLFRVSADEHAPRALWRFFHAIKFEPPTKGTENLFHSTWDIIISHILQLTLPSAVFLRNSDRDTNTHSQRPDFALNIDGCCVFRGEEKGSDSAGDPNQELVAKLDWTYDPLPYVLGSL